MNYTARSANALSSVVKDLEVIAKRYGISDPEFMKDVTLLMQCSAFSFDYGHCSCCGVHDRLVEHHWYEPTDLKQIHTEKICAGCNGLLLPSNMWLHFSYLPEQVKWSINHIMPDWDHQKAFIAYAKTHSLVKAIVALACELPPDVFSGISPIKPPPCPACGFTAKINKSGIRWSGGQKIQCYQCFACGERFPKADKQPLENVKCPQCGCTDRITRAGRKWSHNKQTQLYQCSSCGRKFSESTNAFHWA